MCLGDYLFGFSYCNFSYPQLQGCKVATTMLAYPCRSYQWYYFYGRRAKRRGFSRGGPRRGHRRRSSQERRGSRSSAGINSIGQRWVRLAHHRRLRRVRFPAMVMKKLILLITFMIPFPTSALEIHGRLAGSILPSGLRSITAQERVPILSFIYGVDERTVRAIIHCESRWQPRALNVNKNRSRDHSYWQINSRWTEEMSRTGFDITNPDQNFEAGIWMLSRFGTAPWRASEKCWGPLVRDIVLLPRALGPRLEG